MIFGCLDFDLTVQTTPSPAGVEGAPAGAPRCPRSGCGGSLLALGDEGPACLLCGRGDPGVIPPTAAPTPRNADGLSRGQVEAVKRPRSGRTGLI
jgi:hypothetical protein